MSLPDLSGTGGAGYADITQIRLRFDGRQTNGFYDGNIDNVRLAAAPEPATLAVFGLGLAGLPLVRRRRTHA